jgi:hypothetical protein
MMPSQSGDDDRNPSVPIINNVPMKHSEIARIENMVIFSLKMKLPIMSTMIGAK